MSSHSVRMGFWGCLLFACAWPAADAQFAVIDAASLAQLVKNVATLQKQLATAQNQLTQAQNDFAAKTGGRGMENLLSGTNRNYLPSSWDQVTALGSGGGYGTLSSSYQTQLTGNAILTSQQTSSLSPKLLSIVNSGRQTASLSQALSHTALNTSSQRFALLQQLIRAIPMAKDQKGILDLQARIAAEHSMLQNDHSKLTVLAQALEAEEKVREQRSRELAAQDVGHFRALPAMGLASAIPDL